VIIRRDIILYKAVFVILFSGLLLLAAACSDDDEVKSDIESNKVGGTNSGNSLGEKEAVGLPEKTQNIRLVDAESGLKMRYEPSLEATVRQIIPFGEKVNLLEEQTEEITIGGRNGVWSRISWDGNYGWVFGGFLTESITDTITVDGIDIEVEL